MAGHRVTGVSEEGSPGTADFWGALSYTSKVKI